MIFIDPTELYKRRFEPFDGGYLYYPRAKGGGKLVSEHEYNRLVTKYRRWLGTRFKPGLGFWLLFAGCVLLSVGHAIFEIPKNNFEIAIYALTWSSIAPFFWLYSEPYRLCRDRSDSAPPRAKNERMRASRAMMPWFTVIWSSLMFGLFTVVSFLLAYQEPSVIHVGMTAIFGLFTGRAFHLGWKKLRDLS